MQSGRSTPGLPSNLSPLGDDEEEEEDEVHELACLSHRSTFSDTNWEASSGVPSPQKSSPQKTAQWARPAPVVESLGRPGNQTARPSMTTKLHLSKGPDAENELLERSQPRLQQGYMTKAPLHGNALSKVKCPYVRPSILPHLFVQSIPTSTRLRPRTNPALYD